MNLGFLQQKQCWQNSECHLILFQWSFNLYSLFVYKLQHLVTLVFLLRLLKFE